MNTDLSSGQEVHVRPVQIGASAAVAARFMPLLPSDEQDRAACFRFAHLRHAFVIGRGLLRLLLANYLNLVPVEIKFSYGPAGKPALAAEHGIQFNASHSADLALYAFTTGPELGIDVEQIRPLPDLESIAQRFFSPEESAELHSLNENKRERAFYLAWTRKEAYSKAGGQGLTQPLDNFRVTLQPGQPARFVHFTDHASAAQTWTLHNLALPPDYAGALAYREAERPVTIFPIADSIHLLNLLGTSP